MFLGLFAIGLACGLFVAAGNGGPQIVKFKQEHPVVSIFTLLMGAYLIIYLLDGILVFLLGILLPFCGRLLFAVAKDSLKHSLFYFFKFIATFIHASLRLRSLKNKLTNKMEQIGLKKSTPMGMLLDTFGFEMELVD